MIASQVKQEDKKDFDLLLSHLSTALVWYQKNPSSGLLETIESLNESYELLKAKIENYDYTEEEKVYKKIWESVNYNLTAVRALTT